MGFEYAKPKSASKKIQVKGPVLEKSVLSTMKTISGIVGSTLGPGGHPILIERYEHGLPALITKDGVTVMKSLGFDDPSEHVIMEAARDAAVRTATEAGDGTTTATVLAEALVRYTNEYCKTNPKVSPQAVVRKLQLYFKTVIEPTIKSVSVKADPSLLYSVAKVSANGDEDLAKTVMECFRLVGDDGNVTIIEQNGPSKYEVERIDGYPVPVGLEESCRNFWPKYVNDPGNVRCLLEKPVFIVYHGRITEIQSLIMLLEAVGNAWQKEGYTHNVVLVATDFSESVLGHLAINFAASGTINVFPLLAPRAFGQLSFLQDICALTGATLLDPLSKPLDQATLADLGPGVAMFECGKYRANIIGRAEGPLPEVQDEQGNWSSPGTYEDQLMFHIEDIQTQLQSPASELDEIVLRERLAKVTGGIAKLKVIGSSNGELKERRDRAEDAVCAVRGAIKHGCLPGGGWALLKLCECLSYEHGKDNLALDVDVITKILVPSLKTPFYRLLSNAGLSGDEIQNVEQEIESSFLMGHTPKVFDALAQKFVDPFRDGILDSVPAVLEAIRNSISIASLLGTLGGTVVFKRDTELDRQEARSAQQFMRDANENPADERW